MRSIDSTYAEQLIKDDKNLVILDVRTYSEFKESRIPGAINIPVDELEWELEELEKYKGNKILVYCKVGVRSNIACSYLENEGFKNLYNLRGGILDFNGEIEK